MTTLDPFEFDDAAYVLGALAPDEHAAFEAHLATCAACRDRVRELRPIPGLLAGISADDAFAGKDGPPVPALLWPALLREVRARRKRQRFVIGALTAVAAACVAALVAVLIWPSSSNPQPRTVAQQHTFTAVQPVPIKATARLTATSWGTLIEVRCHYLGTVDRGFKYWLVAVGANGSTQNLGNWKLLPDQDVWYRTGTSLSPPQIRQLEITLRDGTPVLQLNL